MDPTTTQCRTVQLIEPDDQKLVATSSGSADASLDESGVTALAPGAFDGEVTINFQTTKAGAYRFEYLYIDAFGFDNPGAIVVVPKTQTLYGFTVDLSGIPLDFGYNLNWRAVVVEIGSTVAPPVDEPFSAYLPLPALAAAFHVTFPTPRSNPNYGFSELRVENLIDLPGQQTPIAIQVCVKNEFGFTIAMNPHPPNSNYFLSARVP